MSTAGFQATRSEEEGRRRESDDVGQLCASRPDDDMVERCLRGECTAWEALYHQCHPTLLATAMAMVSGRPDRRHASEEIAARVWHQLVADNFRLLRVFANSEGRSLNAYLAGICRHQTLNFLRAERRRRAHEITSGRLDGWREDQDRTHFDGPAFPDPTVSGLAEFTETLTPREMHFLFDFLLAETSDGKPVEYSPSNVRQLRSRICRKLIGFLRG